MKNVLFFLNGPREVEYSRLEFLRTCLGSCKFGVITLNDPLELVDYSPILLKQHEIIYELNSYDLIFYWPNSFQRDVDRLGAAFFDNEYTRRCWGVVERGILQSIPKNRMVNSYEGVCLAANKFVLYSRLQQYKISIPETTITNSIESYYKFRSKIMSVIKTVTDTVQLDEDSNVYTVEAPWEVAGDELLKTPCIVQERINAEYEWRAYSFGNEVITLRIDRARNRAKCIDVRLEFEDNVPIAVDCGREDITNIVVQIRNIFNIEFFSCDFLQSEGKIYVIDLNPHGTWHWLEHGTRELLDYAFARYFAGRLGFSDPVTRHIGHWGAYR
jgi:hypothetical protein